MEKAAVDFINEALAHSWAIWILGAVIFGVLEILLPAFYFIFTAGAALVSALIAVQFHWPAQFIGFTAVLLLSLGIIRPRIMVKLKSSKDLPSRSGALVGKKAKVTEEIDPIGGTGRVSVEGEDWAARSTQSISVGKIVLIEGTDGIVLKVKEN